MRKIFLFVILGLFLPLNIYAFGSFQLLDFSSLPSGISGQPYEATVNFVYSGDWVPSASVIGQSLPSGLNMTDFYVGKNGVGYFKLKGTPSGNGIYKVNILLTDNNGATLLKPIDLLIEDGSVLFNIKSNLPANGVKGVEYKGQVIIDYLGDNKPYIYYSGVPVGVFVNQDESVGIGRGMVQLSFYGAPTRAGNYQISLKVSNEKQTEVRQYSVLVDEFVKVENLVSQQDPKILKTETIEQRVAQTPIKIEQKKVVQPQLVIKESSKDVVIMTTSTQGITPTMPIKEVEKTEDSSYFNKIRSGVKSFLLKLVNSI